MSIEVAGGTMKCPVTGVDCASLGYVYEAEPTGEAKVSVEDGIELCADMHFGYRASGLTPLLECGIQYKALGELVYGDNSQQAQQARVRAEDAFATDLSRIAAQQPTFESVVDVSEGTKDA